MKDLFEYYEEQPKELKTICDKWQEKSVDGLSYIDCEDFLEEVEAIGYTFNYGLDAEPHGLRLIGIELNQLKGWEDIDN